MKLGRLDAGIRHSKTQMGFIQMLSHFLACPLSMGQICSLLHHHQNYNKIQSRKHPRYCLSVCILQNYMLLVSNVKFSNFGIIYL